VQWQLFVTGWDVADVVAMERGVPRIETIERNDPMIEDLLYFAREFHDRLERGELPPVDGSESTRQTLAARYPVDDGLYLPQTPDLAAMAVQLADARAAKRVAEDAERTVGNALRAVIGEASGIDGLVTLRKNADSTRVNWPAVAGAFRKMLDLAVDLAEKGEAFEYQSVREHADTLQSIHSETTPGARVLRLLSKGTTE